MKSIIFVLLAHFHSGDISPVGAFENLEQCRLAQATAGQNQAADYSCGAVQTAGTWSRKVQRILDARYNQVSAPAEAVAPAEATP
jgi:hypothetical protein